MRRMLSGTGIALLALTLPLAAQEFDLDAMIEAAKAEPPITIYDSTGKIVDMAEAFTAKYGVSATGQKVSANAQLEMIIREYQADNVAGDVVLITDAPAALSQLMPQGFVESWIPTDLTDKVPKQYRNPLAVSTNANVWTYNTEAYDSCPVSNVWELTEPNWYGKVAFVDPLTKGTYTDWFNQMERHADAELAAAYKDHFGKDLDTSSESATKQWVKGLAANGPLVTDGDDPASDAVGAPGQAEPFFGLMSSAKFRDNEDKGYKLGLCEDIKPWVGWTYLKLALISAKTDSPNAARLFVHYILTEEGIAPQVADGKISTNIDVKIPDDEPSGIANSLDALFPYDLSTGIDDWETRQDWQDLWTINYSK
ncbi:ABC transporter substrate-binding protein [Devosia naphthalenivorans]|uniref:ABC transporter substrate-binding protein n=1 Tax=Devosia naphthalenivorans TaxID=2082392 RepID=UPI001FE3BB88|nr:ABC transporter substrate-binding protein [Devosia naphthalenivorans]